MGSRFSFTDLALLCFGLALALPNVLAEANPKNSETVIIDAHAAAHPFPHFWEQVFGSERAIVTLRQSYRDDLQSVKSITDFQYVRFHAIFHDEMGVYDEDAQGRPVCNFSYVDQVYDGLLANGVRPFIELSFMPKKLASDPNARHPFWYKQIVSPPKNWENWEHLITLFARHLIERYGIDEVSKWYFEVWNEPNLDFWAGTPRQATYFELYDHSVRSLKAVDSRLRVGGPATAQAAWASDFIRHCAENKIPVDFVSSHVYGNDRPEDVFDTHTPIPRDQMVCRAVKKVHDQIKSSAMPDLPLMWTEYNASYMNEPAVTDTVYMGPWIADTIRQCDGLVDQMSYWTFSDVFEEQGVVKQPFYGGYGLLAERGIPKPAFNAFLLLHALGDERLEVTSDSVLATRRKDGNLVLAAWNLVPPDEVGTARTVTLQFRDTNARQVKVSRVDADHGDVHKAYAAMGSPRYPTMAQVRQLRDAAKLPPPEIKPLKDGSFTTEIPPHGLVLLELESAR
jgi:xylan 1,4-beta-xylosidase